MLTVDDFDAWFHAVHGVEPFPWQRRLMRRVAEDGRWPSVLDLPTGSGKTAAMDIALFHLALEASDRLERRAPVRIVFVVDRRLIVDDAYTRAHRIQSKLDDARDGVLGRVASALRALAGDDAPPVIARRLRGGLPHEDDWARTPAQPTILCSTVDQIGSRLLFRGYGVSDGMKPIHAGLLGSDCLILLDEAHLAEPFRQTLEALQEYRGQRWREADHAVPWSMALLTATPGSSGTPDFAPQDDDKAHPVLRRRLEASKPARLVKPRRGSDEPEDDEDAPGATSWRTAAFVSEAHNALAHFADPANGAQGCAIGIVVNRVARARSVFEQLTRELAEKTDVELLIGPARPVDRDLIATALDPIRTGAERGLQRPLLIVATQCIEAGVDIDLDGLITEAAPLDSLRQRFGRLNRAGREIRPYAAILGFKPELTSRYVDPVYGKVIAAAWERLENASVHGVAAAMVEFGIASWSVPMDPETLTQKRDAPVLMPAHIDLLSWTSPVPEPDVALSVFLHGPDREPDSVTVVWRADLTGAEDDERVRRLLSLVPPRIGEAIQLPVWTVRRWLRQRPSVTLRHLADAPGAEPEDAEPVQRHARPVFRWKGDDERSRWIQSSEVRPGDTVVVPAKYGGVDAYGWNPWRQGVTKDVGALASVPYAGRRFAVRVAPGLVGGVEAERLAEALASAESTRWKELRAALLDLELPEELRTDLARLDGARGRVTVYTDVYPPDDEGRVSGVVFVVPRGLEQGADVGDANATEDDETGSTPGFRVGLEQHSRDVAARAEEFARGAGLPDERVKDIGVAALLHDTGKADRRFQAWLYWGDPLGPDLSETSAVLAKSSRTLPRRAREASGLPKRWRHEALSVRLAPGAPAFGGACDPELVLWLIGSHHGRGRPLFPHADPADAEHRELPCVLGLPRELPPGAGPQSLGFDWNGMDWPALYERVRARYGVWELARMEAILRLADHRASDEEARRLEPIPAEVEA